MTAPAAKTDARTERLLSLITLESQAREKNTPEELAFMMVNGTHHLCSYRQAVFWTGKDSRIHVEAVSGVSEQDSNGPYLLWLTGLLKELIKNISAEEPVLQYTCASCPGEWQEDWKEWCSANAALLLMYDYKGNITGGLWLDREEQFTDADLALLKEITHAYSHAWRALHKHRGINIPGRKWWAVPLLAAIMLLFPVRLSVTAPAEVVAKNPYVISMPFDGVVEEVLVEPNEAVKKGQQLVLLDDTALKNRLENAERELEIARAALVKTERESITDPDKKQELNRLRWDIKIRLQEKAYAENLLERTVIKASQSGVAIFSDPNDLRGIPLQTGEKIMFLSAPQNTELLIRIPIDAMIPVQENIEAKWFLNTRPLSRKTAAIHTISYQASPDPDGLLSYKVRAKFPEDMTSPRVGLTGLARVYGGWSVLGYNILRRPLITLRRFAGI